MEHQSKEADQPKKKMPAVTMIPPSSSSLPEAATTAPAAGQGQGQALAMANIKYQNDAGREAILSVSKEVHYDFGCLSNILNVSTSRNDLDRLADDPNITWVDREGAVYFIQPHNH